VTIIDYMHDCMLQSVCYLYRRVRALLCAALSLSLRCICLCPKKRAQGSVGAMSYPGDRVAD